MTTFRDQIQASFPCTHHWPHAYIGDADAVLAMPEMQAIRKALTELSTVCCDPCRRIAMQDASVPEHVIDWALNTTPGAK
jgi:hypothetical protein